MTKDDFQVLEDGVKQDIANFYAEASLPIHVVLLLDISGSTRDTQAEIRRAALDFVRNLSPDDRVAVIVFQLPAAAYSQLDERSSIRSRHPWKVFIRAATPSFMTRST